LYFAVQQAEMGDTVDIMLEWEGDPNLGDDHEAFHTAVFHGKLEIGEQ